MEFCEPDTVLTCDQAKPTLKRERETRLTLLFPQRPSPGVEVWLDLLELLASRLLLTRLGHHREHEARSKYQQEVTTRTRRDQLR